MDGKLYLRQLKGGRDIGRADPFCASMANFVYLVGDREKGECVVVDPAWDVDGILAAAAEDGMRVVGALATHYHPDHVGGGMMGFRVPQGVPDLLAKNPCKVHCHAAEAEGLRRVTGASASDLETHASGDTIRVGDVEIAWLHTPGHTPGSSCFLCGGALIAGDTLFLDSCGRVDLPGGDVEQMRRSLAHLASLPDELVLYPGHDYGRRPFAPMGEVKRGNPMLRGR